MATTADPRLLLRSELASRRINHPYVSYSSRGSLSCSLCQRAIKSPSLWESHLRSAQHLVRLRTLEPSSSSTTATRKRKAPFDDDQTGGGGGGEEKDDDSDGERKRARADEVVAAVGAVTSEQAPLVVVDEDEWAAFEQDLALTAAHTESGNARTAPSIISAPAMSAAELLARQRSTAEPDADGMTSRESLREARQAELEAEREEAARQLEREFEEMEGLEERVRRLRQKREQLRPAPGVGPERDADGDAGVADGGTGMMDAPDEEESDVEEWDDWRFKTG
ncbi:MAG: hypothetical protein M1826_006197 [Phylliscum demangeonii]|nr:MAG: hypothetical protein M1826_006197 [Phylliscum demangeonii]